MCTQLGHTSPVTPGESSPSHITTCWHPHLNLPHLCSKCGQITHQSHICLCDGPTHLLQAARAPQHAVHRPSKISQPQYFRAWVFAGPLVCTLQANACSSAPEIDPECMKREEREGNGEGAAPDQVSDPSTWGGSGPAAHHSWQEGPGLRISTNTEPSGWKPTAHRAAPKPVLLLQ